MFILIYISFEFFTSPKLFEKNKIFLNFQLNLKSKYFYILMCKIIYNSFLLNKNY